MSAGVGPDIQSYNYLSFLPCPFYDPVKNGVLRLELLDEVSLRDASRTSNATIATREARAPHRSVEKEKEYENACVSSGGRA